MGLAREVAEGRDDIVQVRVIDRNVEDGDFSGRPNAFKATVHLEDKSKQTLEWTTDSDSAHYEAKFGASEVNHVDITINSAHDVVERLREELQSLHEQIAEAERDVDEKREQFFGKDAHIDAEEGQRVLDELKGEIERVREDIKLQRSEKEARARTLEVQAEEIQAEIMALESALEVGNAPVAQPQPAASQGGEGGSKKKKKKKKNSATSQTPIPVETHSRELTSITQLLPLEQMLSKLNPGSKEKARKSFVLSDIIPRMKESLEAARKQERELKTKIAKLKDDK